MKSYDIEYSSSQFESAAPAVSPPKFLINPNLTAHGQNDRESPSAV